MPFGQPEDAAPAEVQPKPIVQVHDRLVHGFKQTAIVMDADDVHRKVLISAVAAKLSELGRLDDAKSVQEAADRGPLIY
jgi:hypothetical protein